jgi:hypothetical protein
MPFNQLLVTSYQLPITNYQLTNLCETNPISDIPKMTLSSYITRDYENKSGSLTMEKQSQNKPNQTQYPAVSKKNGVVLQLRHSNQPNGGYRRGLTSRLF